MKIKFYITLGLLLCAFSAHNSFAATFTAASGAELTIDASNVPGAQDITFNPSTNVTIFGESAPTSFGVAAWHVQAVGKASGQAYAMTADENKMFFMDIGPEGETLPVAADIGTNFSELAGEWNTL